MSTKNIRAVLEWAKRGDAPEELAGALSEVEAIEKAGPAIVAGVLDMQTGMEPRPEFNKALAVIQAIAKESGK